jgi:orotidine-5'-phosphate decarboxylase
VNGATPRLVVALDVPDFERAQILVEQLAGLGVMFKVGLEPLLAYGDRIRALLAEVGADTFIDAKLHDIPRTVAAAIRSLVGPGVKIVNVHALGGAEMMSAAVESAEERAAELGIPAPAIFAVTILTSIAPEELRELGLVGGPGENVIRLAALARDARCTGVVCSSHEVHDLKEFFGTEFLALVGGIRPSGTPVGDQKRVASPREAVQAGADYIVVGRPITDAADPVAVTRSVIADIQR